MGAIVVDLSDFQLRTPEQVVRVFFMLFNQETVREQIWEAFRWYAVNDDKGLSALNDGELRLAVLFDHLIDFVGAVQALRDAGSGERCVICGREGAVGDGKT